MCAYWGGEGRGVAQTLHVLLIDFGKARFFFQKNMADPGLGGKEVMMKIFQQILQY